MQQMASRPFATINVALETDEEPPDLIGGNVKMWSRIIGLFQQGGSGPLGSDRGHASQGARLPSTRAGAAQEQRSNLDLSSSAFCAFTSSDGERTILSPPGSD
ncbi:attractin isoform X2 [Lates japonicus]|uniref:Attractin isoform X2 n=1 Tax=Lates japonicus TaxID=270547 RepID=A0AAD3QX68_LATJO|nr:attractin isoform X2 [Lates japonicus]